MTMFSKKLLLALVLIMGAIGYGSKGVLAQGGSGSQAAPVIRAASAATIAAPCVNGSNPVVNNGNVYVCKATVWTALASGSGTIGGSITNGQVAYGSGANAIQGTSGFTFNGTNLLVGTSGQGVQLHNNVNTAIKTGYAASYFGSSDVTSSGSNSSTWMIGGATSVLAGRSNGVIGFSSSSSDAAVAVDTAIVRGAAGVIWISNGDANASGGLAASIIGLGNSYGNMRWTNSGALLQLRNDFVAQWSNSTDAPGGTKDLGFARNGVNTMEINTGTAGTYADLRLRSIGIGAAVTANVQAEIQNVSSSGNALIGIDGYAYGTTASSNLITGVKFGAYIGASALTQTGAVVGADMYAINAGSVSATPLIGGRFAVSLTSTGNVTNGYGAQINAAAASGGGAFTSVAGLAIANQTVATNNTALLIGTTTIPSGSFDIYSTNTTATVFGTPGASGSRLNVNKAGEAVLTLYNSSASSNNYATIGIGSGSQHAQGYFFFDSDSAPNVSKQMFVFNYGATSSQFVIGKAADSNGASILSQSTSYQLRILDNLAAASGGTGLEIGAMNSGNSTATSGARTNILINGGFVPTSGTGTFVSMLFNPTVNQTGGASGITRGIGVQPTLTSAADYRHIEVFTTTSSGTNQAGVVIGALSGATNNTQLLLGTSSIPSGSYAVYQTGSAYSNYFQGHVGITTLPQTTVALSINKSFTDMTANQYGIQEYLSLGAGGSQDQYGQYLTAYFNSTTTTGTGALYASRVSTIHNGTVSASNLVGQQTIIQAWNSGNISNGYGFFAASPVLASTGVIVTNYGFYGGNQGAAGITTSYGLFLANQTGSTTNYAIYSAGGASVLNAGTASVNILTLKEAASPTGNIIDMQNSSGASLSKFDAAANFFAGPSTIETFTTTGSAFGATLNYYTDSQTIYRNTGTAANDVTVNVDASASVDLNTRLAVGQAITVVVTITNGGVTAYKVSALNIHSVAQTIKWPGGTAPTAGLSEEDWYTFTIMKTGSSTYFVTGVMTAFK